MKVYPGADSSFVLYSDDGQTYAYERGDFTTTTLHWDDARNALTQTGTHLDLGIVQVVGR